MPKKNYDDIINDVLVRCADALCVNPSLDMMGLARQTGISRPKMYRYFSSREDLIVALAIKSLRDIEEACDGIFENVENHKKVFSKFFDAIMPLGTRFHFLTSELWTCNNEQVNQELNRQNVEFFQMIKDAKVSGAIRSELPTVWIADLFDALIVIAWTQTAAGTIAQNDAPSLAFDTFWRAVGLDTEATHTTISKTNT
jgi:TetR/AcrR family transcriptional regulator, mexCD-oprJ operon repressor